MSPSLLPVISPAWDVVDLFQKGGFIMWPLLFLSFVAAIIFFLCLWTTRRGAVLPYRFVSEVEVYLRKKDYGGLLALCDYNDSSFSRTVQVMVMFLQRNPMASFDEVRDVAAAEGSRQANILTRQISWLSDIGAIAPMLGLLGTVIGMMKTFIEIADGNFEGVKQMQMAGGIAEALITTAGGLILGIPAVCFYAIFRSRVQKRITDMEAAITHILSIVSIQMDRENRLGVSAAPERLAEPLDDDDEY